MYFNDVHIGYYLVAAIVGLFVGQMVDWANKRLPEYKKVISLDIVKEYKKSFKPNYILMLLTSIIYITLIYNYGIKETIVANLDLIKFLILTPLLLSAFVIDYRLQIIPNRLNLTIFEIGILFAFVYGLSDVAITLNMLLGMVAGAGIFLLITLDIFNPESCTSFFSSGCKATTSTEISCACNNFACSKASDVVSIPSESNTILFLVFSGIIDAPKANALLILVPFSFTKEKKLSGKAISVMGDCSTTASVAKQITPVFSFSPLAFSASCKNFKASACDCFALADKSTANMVVVYSAVFATVIPDKANINIAQMTLLNIKKNRRQNTEEKFPFFAI